MAPTVVVLLALAGLAQANFAPAVVTKIGETYDEILAVRNKSNALLQPWKEKAVEARAAVANLKKQAQVAPNTEIVGAAYQNRTADPKLLALQTFNDVYNNKKSQVEIKLGRTSFCKSVDSCADPQLAVVNKEIGLLNSFLSIFNDNMAPNPVLAEIAAANGVAQAPVNTNTATNVRACDPQTPITSYTTGHTVGSKTVGLLNVATNIYTEWISVMLEEPDSTCQQDSQTGPSCAVACARRGMTCDPCAMTAATANFESFAWAASQAGQNDIVDACRNSDLVANGPKPDISQVPLKKGAGTGWFGYLCGVRQSDNFVLYNCNAPDYASLVAQGYSDACQVPTWRVGRNVIPDQAEVGAEGGALCFCRSETFV